MISRSHLVNLLSVFFGLGAWVAVNGLWVELPLLVQELPEGWGLPSYLSVVIQLANIGPIAYLVLRLLRPNDSTVGVIYVVLGVGCLASALLAFFWDQTTEIGGNCHSTALLVLVFFLALVDCTSSVLYVPYMAVWKSGYLSFYLIGEGLSGLLPALVALTQGTGGSGDCVNVTVYNETVNETTWHMESEPLDPNFSIEVFLFVIFSMMFCSAIAFILLENLKLVQLERASVSVNPNSSGATPNVVIQSNLKLLQSNTQNLSMANFYFLLILQGWSSMLANGLLPSIQAFSCGPYGNEAYHLAATLSALANPVAAFITVYAPRASAKFVGALGLCASAIASYIFYTALESPSPPFVDETIGAVLVVVAWILFLGVVTYVRVEIANIMRTYGEQPLFWSGVATQGGSAIGAVLGFVMVNYTSFFTQYYPCS